MIGRTRIPATFYRLSAIDLAGVAIAAALIAILVVGVLGPLSLRSRQAAAQAENAVRQKQRNNGTVTAVRTLTEDISRTRARIAASPLRLRTPDALNQQLASVVGLAAECGLGVDDVKPGVAVRGVRFIAIPITLTGRGSYRASAAFLHRLHDQIPDVGVCGFRLVGNPEHSDADGHYAFDLQWIALPTSAPAGAVALTQ